MVSYEFRALYIYRINSVWFLQWQIHIVQVSFLKLFYSQWTLDKSILWYVHSRDTSILHLSPVGKSFKLSRICTHPAYPHRSSSSVTKTLILIKMCAIYYCREHIFSNLTWTKFKFLNHAGCWLPNISRWARHLDPTCIEASLSPICKPLPGISIHFARCIPSPSIRNSVFWISTTSAWRKRWRSRRRP